MECCKDMDPKETTKVKPKLIKINVNNTWHQFDTNCEKSELLYPALSEWGALTLTEEQALDVMQQLINHLVNNARFSN